MKRKGFTLIELLAVIVILAIIALIATPLILNVVEESKKKAKESSAHGYLEALEQYQITAQLEGKSDELVNALSFSNENGGLAVTVASINNKIAIKGEKPSEGHVTFNNGKIINYQLQYDEYLVKYDLDTNKVEVKKEQYGGLGVLYPDLYPEFKIGDQITIDGVSYHVIKSSSTGSDEITLLRDESIGEIAFDENGGTDYETSTLKTYLNTTYKETFGDKQQYIKEITLMDFGTWTPVVADNISPADDISGEEGTYAYLYKHGYTSILGEETSMLDNHFWTKTKYQTKGGIIIGCYIDTSINVDKYLIDVAYMADSESEDGKIKYASSNALGSFLPRENWIKVRPVIVVLKNILL